MTTDAAVERWAAADLAAAVLPADRRFVAESSAVRALILDLAGDAETVSDELFDACAVLGGLVAEHRASPTLAAVTIDHALAALDLATPPWAAAARAAVAEGFARGILEDASRESLCAWEFPRCVVPLGDDAVAVAASYPSDDREALTSWAARIAQGAALRGARRAIVAGPDLPRHAVLEALAIVGIEASDAGTGDGGVR
jgi:hypothetical protein